MKKTAKQELAGNALYYGDNLDIMRRYLPDESVDLIYLDPPFNSAQNYNVLFKEKDGTEAASQIRAFEDTWTWGKEDEIVYADLVMAGGKVSDVMKAFRTFLGPCDMLAYLVMMAPRLIEMRRVMKPTASIYLHCDSAASHYLKLLMDAIYYPQNFINEIIWQRTSSHNDSKKWGHVHDTLLYYAKTDRRVWNPVFLEHDPEYIEQFYRYKDKRGVYRLDHIIRSGSMGARPNLAYEYKGYKPQWGWRVKEEKLRELDRDNRVQWSKTGRPYLKRYLAEQMGTPIKSVITDIPPIGPQAAERLGYPTQKPEALLERIILASSNEGDVVLDPFCGCGTAVVVSQKTNRHWIGIDITHLAIALMKQRLKDTFGEKLEFKIVGEPVSLPDAKALAASDKYQFQWWALDLVGARPAEEKKGADKGIDGKIIFQGERNGDFESVIISVKAGHVNVAQVRDLRGVLDREAAAIGVMIMMEEPTGPMKTEAVTAGFYESEIWGRKYPRVQLLTVAELMAGGKIDMPPIRQVGATFKKAPQAKGKTAQKMNLPLDED